MTTLVGVTGVTGFIGRALVERLVRDGYSVRVALRQPSVNLPSGVEPVVVGDFSGETDWSGFVAGCSALIHCAGLAHVLDKSQAQDAELFQRVNHHATVALAAAARTAGVQRFIFISSIGVHGTQSDAPVTEASPLVPKSPYAVSKLDAENALRKLCAEGSTGLTIIRPPLVYGPKAKGNFSRLLKLVKSGLPLPFGGAVLQRSMVGIDNLVDFIAACLDNPEAAGQSFVVSDAERTSVRELCSLMALLAGKKLRLIPVPAGAMRFLLSLTGQKSVADGLFAELTIDTSYALKRLGWRPPFTQLEELERAVGQDA